MNRRQILALSGVGALIAAAGGGVAYRIFQPSFVFEPVSRPAGFRRLPRGDGLSVGRFLVGLDAVEEPRLTLSDQEICALTIGAQSGGPGTLTLSLFSDFFCPYCRVLDLQVRNMVASDQGLHLVAHEVPLLGRSSEFAARAVIAAARQDAYDAFHARLIRTTFVPNPAYLRSVAEEEGLDVAQFQNDLVSAETDQTLLKSAALFKAFGFVGTPALTVGRTLVNGAISRAQLRALIRLERAEVTEHLCV